ncbi:hypothetical protein [Algoriphagus litoralis]|uniref:hypothetical protein n=1 Tax=Algoriphagus litoralis TaxID=2202829 RepID=UPI0013009291|nr:hypothetical protein [Algoriphagus litoralis]
MKLLGICLPLWKAGNPKRFVQLLEKRDNTGSISLPQEAYFTTHISRSAFPLSVFKIQNLRGMKNLKGFHKPRNSKIVNRKCSSTAILTSASNTGRCLWKR